MPSADGMSLLLDQGFTANRSLPVPAEPRVHPDVELDFVWAGSVRVLFACGEMTLHAGSLAVFWAGMPHRVLEAGPAADLAAIAIPLGWFLGWDLDPAFVQRLLAGDVVTSDSSCQDRVQRDRLAFEEWIRDLSTTDPTQHRAAYEEMGARIRRLSKEQGLAGGAESSSDVTAGSERQMERVQQVVRFVAENYQQPLSVRMIANHVRLHPNYVMAIFKASFGIPIWEYVVRVRISHAQRLLLTTKQSALRVSVEAGFGSPARFYDAFRRYVGMSPLAFRDRQRLQ